MTEQQGLEPSIPMTLFPERNDSEKLKQRGRGRERARERKAIPMTLSAFRWLFSLQKMTI